MKVRAAFCVALGLLSACTLLNSDYNPGQGDGPNGGPDLSLPPEGDGGGGGGDGGAGLSCGELKQLVETGLKGSVKCQVDADCVMAHTACGLAGSCSEVYASKDWRTPSMDGYLKDWTALMCAPQECACPAVFLPPPACNEGVCGPKPIKGGIGAACTHNGDCLSGQCLSEAQDKTFSGGYCTVKNCGAAACPAGSECKGQSGGTRICLLDCTAAAKVCRTGYGCCSGPGPGRGTGWCSPQNSFLCLAL